MGGLLALNHTALTGKQESKSGRRGCAHPPKQGHRPVSECGMHHCDPTVHRPRTGKPVFQEGWRPHCGLKSLGAASAALPFFIPMRTCAADPESGPRIRGAHVCKYSLKWKHGDCSWTFFQHGDVNPRHESQWSDTKRAF